MTIYLHVVEQVRKSLIESLIQCKANFRYANMGIEFTILQVERIRFDRDTTSGHQLAINFSLMDSPTTNTVIIQTENIKQFHITT